MQINLGENMFGDLDYASFPKMAKVKQRFECPSTTNIEERIISEMDKSSIDCLIRPGMKIAVLVGSRGIANIDRIVRILIDELKKRGANPFIVPAMASHGGATEKGQRLVLASYGITEETMGVEIRCDMEPELVGETEYGVKIWFDRNALHADGVIPVNRIKCHTAFRGKTESGLMKMMAIGAGKQKGAESLHSYGADKFASLLPDAYDVIRKKVNLLFGLGIVENAHEETALIEAVPGEVFREREEELLVLANQWMSKIMIDHFDALLVHKTGKNYSGDGMDPNIMGRFAVPGMTGGPDYQRMALLDVSDESHGNAVGMGLADVIPRRLLEKADFSQMYMNAFTSKMVTPIVKIPMIAKDDKEAVGVMLRLCCRVQKGKEKVVAIKNTLDLNEIWVSEALLEEIKDDPRFEILSKPEDIPFDEEGNCLLFDEKAINS